MKHSEVADAFVNGASARNRRLTTDGQSIELDGRVMATRAADGTIVVWSPKRSRYAHIARSAIDWSVMMSQARHVFVGIDSRAIWHHATRDELLAAYAERQAFRAKVGLPL